MENTYSSCLAMPSIKISEDIEDPESLLKPEEVCVVSLKEPAHSLHSALFEALQPNPEGIYIKGQLMPVVKPGQKLFALNSGKSFSYDQIAEIQDDVCDEDGNVLIKKELMLDKARLLNYGGYYPVSALQLLKANVDLNLRRFCKFAVPFSNESTVLRYLKPGYKHILNEGYLDTYTNDIIEQLHEFIVKDLWRIYFTKVKSDNLFIEKSVDYRIYEWTKMQYEKLHPEHDN